MSDSFVRRWVVHPAVRSLTDLPLIFRRPRLIVPVLLALALVLMQVFVTWSGLLYPLRPDTIAAIGHPFTPDPVVLANAWGGPTLAGAWLVHAAIALGIQTVCAMLLRFWGWRRGAMLSSPPHPLWAAELPGGHHARETRRTSRSTRTGRAGRADRRSGRGAGGTGLAGDRPRRR
ncbi:MAG: hypothetical protein ABW046_05295 [Actinoplanes sp.]